MSTIELFTNDEKDGFMATADRIGKFLDLYRSCQTRVSRNYVLHNAKVTLLEDEYWLLMSMCIDWIDCLLEKEKEKNRRPDEPHDY